MLWHCNSCTCAYSPGAPRCPQCGADDHHEQGEPGRRRCRRCASPKETQMAKLSKLGGLSDATAPAPAAEAEVEDAGAEIAAAPEPDIEPEPEAAVTESDDASETGAPDLERPSERAPKAAWIAYCEALGAEWIGSPEAFTKDELIGYADEFEAEAEADN